MEVRFIDSSLSRWEVLIIAGVLVGMLVVLSYLLPREVLVVVFAIGSMATVYYSASVLLAYYSNRLPDWVQTVPIWLTFILPFSVTAVLIGQHWRFVSPLALALVIALLLVFFYYWFVVPLALYQKIAEQHRTVSITDWPVVDVLVPAYNEEGYIGPCIDALLNASYPPERLNVIVVDDGSTDDTLAEARRHATERVTVLSKQNGGKHSALNHGLQYAHEDLLVTIDADSVVDDDAIRELVCVFEARPDASAVAGNVKVVNRDSLLTNVQALEYILGINTFRRAFDLLGVVTVVPGCLGLFRRDVLDSLDGYDDDTLTEDFDLTIQILKQGGRIYHGNAIVYTEAPDTWWDLYQQRLRWFRGNIQTVVKHRRVLVDGRFGLLHRVALPYVLFSMSVLPFLGLFILAVIVWSVVMGAYVQVLGMFTFFAALQVVLSLLAIRIDADDWLLARYAPLTVLGYKQVLDGVLLKSFVDVFYWNDLPWTSPRRRRQRDETATDNTE